MKLYLYLLPAVLTLSCTEGSKFKGAAASATVEKTDQEPTEDAEPSEIDSEEPTVVTSDPVVKVDRIGINFEDSPDGDDDYNDAVLCFEGAFDVTSKTIVSSKDQTVEPLYFSAAGCEHKLEVTIYRGEEKIYHKEDIDPKLVVSATVKQDDLVFKKGDRLEVKLRPKSAACGGPNVVRLMTDPVYGKFEKNTCNNFGK